MKLKPLEILASALAAVLAAVAASAFGVKGTIIGAGIGSAIATSAAALFNQSAARAQVVVAKKVVPKYSSLTSSLPRRTVGTSPTGEALATSEANDVAEPDATAVGAGATTSRGATPQQNGQVLAHTRAGSGPANVRFDSRRVAARSRWRLPLVVVASTVCAFVLAVGIVTVVELGAGRSLSSLFGGPPSGTTVGGVVNGVATTTTTTTTPKTSTTTTAPATATTTAPSRSTTTSTSSATTTSPTTTTTAPTTTTTPVSSPPTTSSATGAQP